MKEARAKTAKIKALDDIMKTLKRVPTTRLGVVKEFVHALATPPVVRGQRKARVKKKLSLVESPFCGMWKDREDITDGRTFARQLREMVETRGDRSKNLR